MYEFEPRLLKDKLHLRAVRNMLISYEFSNIRGAALLDTLYLFESKLDVPYENGFFSAIKFGLCNWDNIPYDKQC